jgi:hypothetical protein
MTPEWLAVKDVAAAVAAENNVLRRNRGITAAYALTFLMDESLKWPGVAAFASRQVGHTMRQAALRPGRRYLAEGNRAVFMNIYPALRFYLQYSCQMGATVIKLLTDTREVEDAIINALREMSPPAPAPGAPAAADPWLAAWMILKHEQENTLQRAIFDRKEFRWLVWLGRVPPLSVIWPVEVCFGNSCRSSSAGFTVRMLGRLEEVDNRLTFARSVLDRFRYLLERIFTADKVYRALVQMVESR